MVPMCQKLIDTTLLTPRERDWLNAYHKEVREKVKGYFEGGGKDERTMKWVLRETEEI